MKHLLLSLIFFSWSYANTIGIKTPTLRNLPYEYKNSLINFFITAFSDIEKYNPEKKYSYVIKPFFSSIAGSYNLCLDIYSGNNIIQVMCISASDCQALADKFYLIPKKINFLKFKSKPIIKNSILKILTSSKKFEEKLKVVSRNGDTLINYIEIKKPEINGKNQLTVGKSIINIDTVILNNLDANRLFEKILQGYRFREIIILNIY